MSALPDAARGLLAAVDAGRDPAAALRDLRRALAGVPAECDCEPRHEWPCAAVPRCDEPGCGEEASCGWPSPGGYRRTCGAHWARLDAGAAR